jgi:hypothetical protein
LKAAVAMNEPVMTGPRSTYVTAFSTTAPRSRGSVTVAQVGHGIAS